jgi:hypothetical protein
VRDNFFLVCDGTFSLVCDDTSFLARDGVRFLVATSPFSIVRDGALFPQA